MLNQKKRVILTVIAFLALILPVMLLSDQRPLDGNGQIYSKWEWKEASINAVFDNISTIAGVDIVSDPSVKGKITLSLTDKTWQQAFDVICQMNDLHSEEMDSYIYVMGNKEFLQNKLKMANNRRSLENVADLQKIMIKLQNTTAINMVTPAQGVLSKRGKITAVEHTNSIIIEDLPEQIPEIRAFIKKMDEEVLQISISAKIIEVSSGTQNDIGIQWSFFDNSSGASVAHLPPAGGNVLSSALEKATYGILDEKGFQVALEYLYTETKSEIVAEPQVTTLENHEARIFMGSKIPYTRLDESGNSVLEQLDARTELIVTPHITGSGQIGLDLEPTKKSYELTADGPIINEQGAKTAVVIQDGETIVIGGLSADDDQQSEGGIPFLKDIPIIGYLFKTSSKKVSKKDLVIFVTPRIIKSTALAVRLQSDKEKQKNNIISNDPTEVDNGFSVE